MNLLVPSALTLAFVSLFSATPSSTNYNLKAFDFGNGGGTSSSTNYGLNGMTNGQAGNTVNSATYLAQPGVASTINANVPMAPTFTNPNNYYDRLKLVIAVSSNPLSTKYAIAISSDNFVTTYYVRADNTIGTGFSIANYQTYALWGGAGGFNILGLTPNTTYKTKIKALNGNFSETAFGPVASAATVNPSITFAVTTSLSATPPYGVTFSNLTNGTVYSADADPQLALTTNAVFGGYIYVNDKYGGLKSASASYTLASATANLLAVAKGYGAQVSGASQVSGGPISSVGPYNGASDNVGILSSSLQPILGTSSAVSSATASVRLKAKTDIFVPLASDYTDTLTFTAAMLF